MKNLDKATLADLISLYNNYILVVRSGLQIGVAYQILEDWEIKDIREEIFKRVNRLR